MRSMLLLLFRSLWTNGLNVNAAIADCHTGLFNGIEGPVPPDAQARMVFARKIRGSNLPFIAEITTGGGYVPARSASPAVHIDDFRKKIEMAMECRPLFVTVLAGCDAWPLAQSVEFFGRLIRIANEFKIAASFETHRGRPTFNPWSTRDLLSQLPTMRLTIDFSHWCCVGERLIMDTEPDILKLCAERAYHVHARVGYEQGPQVPHPAAPEYRSHLEAHERWWKRIWKIYEEHRSDFTTMTPEFGPGGYLQTKPFGGEPVADLDEINRWMAKRQREQFSRRHLPSATPA